MKFSIYLGRRVCLMKIALREIENRGLGFIETLHITVLWFAGLHEDWSCTIGESEVYLTYSN